MTGPRAAVFLDFDGTITVRDATDAILEAFADPAWVQLEDAWLSGLIGSRECLAAQMALVTATREEVDLLLDGIGVDPGFTVLLDACAARAMPVHIVSDGFDYCIERILARQDLNLVARLTDSQIVSSILQPADGRQWRVTFTHPPEPCAHGCATCKPAAMARLTAVGAVTVFVGDGISDRYAATCADIVFAKDKLAAYCEGASIPYAPYDTLAAVAEGVERLLRAGLPAPPSFSAKGFPAV
jgi:2-hydroxy-3-keto-5-methylthiopentenyl-1-phosphate phosphatase